MNRSYKLPNGELIFVYDCQSAYQPPWRIGIVKKSKYGKSIVNFPPFRNRRWGTEIDALIALKKYAEKEGLDPAY